MLPPIALIDAVAASRRAVRGATPDRPRPTRPARPAIRIRHDGE
jgi:hypothetical protein